MLSINHLIVLQNLINGRSNDVAMTTYFTELLKLPISMIFNRIRFGTNALNIGKIKAVGDGTKLLVSLTGIERPIVIPNDLKSLTQLRCTARELINPFNPHFYESHGTKIRKKDVVVDCGAAEGLFTAIAAEKAEHVYAIEPLPEYADILRDTFRESHHVEVIACALGDKDGTARLENMGTMSKLSENGSTIVTLRSIDSLFFNKDIKVDFIKADLEGSEISMIRGARKTIESNKPRIAITTYDGPEYASIIKSILIKYNPDYHIRTKGIITRLNSWSDDNLNWPIMLHAS